MSIQVRINFNDSVYDYDMPLVQSVSDPKEAMKATVIHGNRANGALIIPGGKKSIEIQIRGKLVAQGYKAITELIQTMRTSITTDPATLTMKNNDGSGWVTDWSYSVRRIEEIGFPASKRTSSQDYDVIFLVTAF